MAEPVASWVAVPAYLGVCEGAHSVQVGDAAAESQAVSPGDWDVHGINVSLLRGGRAGPLGSSELAA